VFPVRTACSRLVAESLESSEPNHQQVECCRHRKDPYYARDPNLDPIGELGQVPDVALALSTDGAVVLLSSIVSVTLFLGAACRNGQTNVLSRMSRGTGPSFCLRVPGEA
jgi:hypothetical protein